MADEDTIPDEYAADDPNSSREWLDRIVKAEKVFDDYQNKCDNIDRQYANLERLANDARDRQMQLFWANIQVLGPSIYSRPPVPVVVPRFKDRKALPRVSSEVLERSAIVSFEQSRIDDVMRLIRDDLAVVGRGAVWCRYETKGEENLSEKVCHEHVDRKDFLHAPARHWLEVPWVAKRSWLDKEAMKKRFDKSSKGKWTDAAFEEMKDDKQNNAAEDGVKAGVWEIWSKDDNRVYWVTEGVDVLLDEGEPHLTLEGFFPCPKPAYGTVQRRSLIPVPDMLFYKDQLEEINEITARVSALTEGLRLRGFYPAGASEIGDAVQAAVKMADDNQVLIPISNWAAFGGPGGKDIIIWLPLDMVAKTILQLIELRGQLIEDVYQITGLSDIMRGQTDPNETKGAQDLKAQYGSVRVRDRQDELIRIARDVTRITTEIMAENFKAKTLMEMSQLDIPTNEDIAQQVTALKAQAQQIAQQIEQAKADPEIQQMAAQNPEKAQEVMGQAQQQIASIEGQIGELGEKPTVEEMMSFLRDQRLRPFVLDIETDSTIAPDENAQKQRATEFITAVGSFMGQALPLVEQVPQAATLASEMLKFVAGQFRAGREMESTIEEFADQMKQTAGKGKGPSPEQMKAEADAKATQVQMAMDQQKAQQEAQTAQVENAERMQALQSKQAQEEQDRMIRQQEAEDAAAARQMDLQGKANLMQMQMVALEQKHGQDMDKGALEITLLQKKIEQSEVATENSIQATKAKTENGAASNAP